MSIKASWIHLSSLPFQSVPVQIKISLHSPLSVTEIKGGKKQSRLFITLTALILDTFEPMSVKSLYRAQLSVIKFLTLRQISLCIYETSFFGLGLGLGGMYVFLRQSLGSYLACTLTAVPRYPYGHRGPLPLWVHLR